jgi:hypothetical protein
MKKVLLIVVACAVGLTFSLAFASRGESRLADCSRLSVPLNSDFNLAYSPTTGVLLIDYYDAAGHGADAVVDSRDAACKSNAGVARAIEHAKAASRDVTAGECASFKALLNGAPAVKKGGRTIKVAAAQDYVTQNCH